MAASVYLAFVLGVATFLGWPTCQARVRVAENQLIVDGEAQPQIFGAEFQYFRVRGGYGPNVPREKVIQLWAKGLDRMKQAKMNFVSFYIPWDFHEYKEGKFDFTGTADEDGDGNADYPSRDLITFFGMLEERGFNKVMVRPGPYINAEWGFLGFGAIPLWFHEKYPDSHMHSSDGKRTKLYDYHYEPLLQSTEKWFKTLYEQVLKSRIGPGKPIVMLQLDNETNYMWQSLFNHDYSPRATARYQKFLEGRYATLAALNSAHRRDWKDWNAIQPPKAAGKNLPEDRDWYRFHDQEIVQYLEKLRRIWEGLGIREPEVLFTLAESYNAQPGGLIPHPELRNLPGQTGLMTVNLYPKTTGSEELPLFSQPFKADHDVKSATAAGAHYFGSEQEWSFGPEIQGGWWRGIPVSGASRQQTYLSTMGHGLKGLIVYYFHEGHNWQAEWAREQVRLHFERLKQQRRLARVADKDLPDAFWRELQTIVEQNVLMGIDARHVWFQSQAEIENLFFDAPLDAEMNPRPHFAFLEEMGRRLIEPYGSFLGQAVSLHDDVTVLKDTTHHLPTPWEYFGLTSIAAATDWSAALVGSLLVAGVNPRIGHEFLLTKDSGFSSKTVLYQNTGSLAPGLHDRIEKHLAAGGIWINFLVDTYGRDMGWAYSSPIQKANGLTPLSFYLNKEGALVQKSETAVSWQDSLPYAAPTVGRIAGRCEPIMYSGQAAVAYRCRVASGGYYYHFGVPFYAAMNTPALGESPVPGKVQLLWQGLLRKHQMTPRLEILGTEGKVAVFARRAPGDSSKLWVTLKNSSHQAVTGRLRPTSYFAADLNREASPVQWIRVRDLLKDTSQSLSAVDLNTAGLEFSLPANGSTVLWFEVGVAP